LFHGINRISCTFEGGMTHPDHGAAVGELTAAFKDSKTGRVHEPAELELELKKFMEHPRFTQA